MNRIPLPALLALALPLCLFAQAHYPPDVEKALHTAGPNRPQLEKAIRYFQQQADPLKLKAAYFLIANMDIHMSYDYYWADKTGRRVPFNELSYPDWSATLSAFDQAKKKYPGIHPVPVKYRDIDSIKADYLIGNINGAFDTWRKKWSKNVSFSDFCEYILPYRISKEPLQDWRPVYRKRFSWINDSARNKGTADALNYFAVDYNSWFTNTYKIESRSEPLPRLGALQLLLRKKGPCEDIADLEVFTWRSQGIPAAIDEIPSWATSSGKHFLSVAFTPQMKPIPFDVSNPAHPSARLPREPAKVIRVTYSKQPSTLAAIIAATSDKAANSETSIPPGFLRTTNYLDVTPEYWPTKDVSCSLFTTSPIAYACVFSFLKWQPVWWGKPAGNTVTFTKMCKGAVYLPMTYNSGKLKPAGYPRIAASEGDQELKPDTLRRRTIHLQEQPGYLLYRPNKRYRLFYWDNQWKLIAELRTAGDTKTLVFTKVPSDALLLLVPEYTQKKERPFTIAADGTQYWW
jgi:hypothetical protein